MANPLLLVVGLGNPGTKYAGTPHNLGFEVVDAFAAPYGVKYQEKFQSHFGEIMVDGRKVYVLKPLTYMNLSGQAVQEATRFYKIPPESILVVSDDLDLPFGQLRLRLSGGSGGHNGLVSVIESLSSEMFPRLRVGVGRPEKQENVDFLLGKVSKGAKDAWAEAVKRASDAVKVCVVEGVALAMNKVNQKKEEKK